MSTEASPWDDADAFGWICHSVRATPGKKFPGVASFQPDPFSLAPSSWPPSKH